MLRQTTEGMKKSGSAEGLTANPEPKQIEALAYQLWLERGCTDGNDQEDWFRAEEQLRNRKSVQRAA